MVKVMVALVMVMLSVSAQADSPPQYRELLRIERGQVLEPAHFLEHMAFSPDGTQIAASGGEDVRIWDISSGEVVQTFAFTSGAVSWSPDGRYIATGTRNNGLLSVWDAETGANASGTEGFTGRHSTWSPDSRQIVTDVMMTYDVQSRVTLVQLDSQWNVATAVYWSPDGTMIATAGGWTDVPYLHIWSADGERLDTYWAGTEGAWSPDSTRFASAMQVREVATGLPVLILPEMRELITWHPSGAWLTSSNAERGEIVLWDANTGAQVEVWTFEDCFISGFTWSTDGQHFAVSCQMGEPNFGRDLLIGEVIL
ncbi:MAG: WD40 repeat domain-containing protein [Anaerolineae bacterium]|jgi:WD40 repeat protein|nr:WD40 repeat domain-containing protein [Anaerolineae bacterium]